MILTPSDGSSSVSAHATSYEKFRARRCRLKHFDCKVWYIGVALKGGTKRANKPRVTVIFWCIQSSFMSRAYAI